MNDALVSTVPSWLPDWTVVLPPIVAIALAIWRRDVIIALVAALWVGETLMVGGNPAAGFLAMVTRVASVLQSAGDTRVLLYASLIGALIGLLQASGAVTRLADNLARAGAVTSRRRAGVVTAGIGIGLFIETTLSMFTAGLVGRAFAERFAMTRARLAYLIDSTCAPISVLILINGWGAYALGLIDGYDFERPAAIVAATIPLNFYALIAVGMALYTAFSDKAYFGMDTVRAPATDAPHAPTPSRQPDPVTSSSGARAHVAIVPLLALVGLVPAFMAWTGGGDILAGSGSTAVLWSVAIAVTLAYVLIGFERVMPLKQMTEAGVTGIGALAPAVILLLLAFALSDSLRALGTGPYLAGMIADGTPVFLIPAAVFALSGVIAFSTGTSWGTYGLMIPLAMPLALAVGAPPALVLAAVLGGGVFGDHCSPISDTTVISSLAAECDHFEHVRTQLPYALIGAGASIVLYLVAGILMG